MTKSNRHRIYFAALLLGSLGILSAQSANSTCCAAPTSNAQTCPVGGDTYPLTTCVVSGEPLKDSDMGAPIDYIHKEAGKPDRLVRFCCPGCIKKFKKDPAKYLAKLDAAAAAKTGTSAATAAMTDSTNPHAGHSK